MLMSWMSRLYGAGSGWHLLRGVCSKLVNQLSRVNNITAKLTNQFTQTGLSTFDWQQPFTWLWWLPLRLSKRQSPLPTTVLLGTTLTRTIKLHYYMLPPGSNHLPSVYRWPPFDICVPLAITPLTAVCLTYEHALVFVFQLKPLSPKID